MATIKDPSGVDILGADGLPIYFSLPDTLGSHGYITNVKRSLDKYINDNVCITNNIRASFHGLQFDNTSVVEWIETRIADIKRVYLRQGSNTEYAYNTNISYTVFINVKKSGATTSDRHYKIKDIIHQFFKYSQKIALYNYIEDASFITYMKVREVEDNSSMQESLDLYKYMIQYRIDFTELTIQP